MAPGARGANKPIPGGKTVRSGPNQTFPGHSAARDPGSRRGKGKRNRGGGGGGAQGSRASLPPRPAPEPSARGDRTGGSWGSAGQSERRAPGGCERRGLARARRPHRRVPSRLRPPSSSASRSASCRPAGSPAGLRERPARAGRGPGREVVQDPGTGAGVAEGLRGRERGPGAVSPRSSKFLAGVARPPLRTPSNGPRAAGPCWARRTPGWEGRGRPRAGSGGVRAGSGEGGSSPEGSGPSSRAGGVAEPGETFLGNFYMVKKSPLSRLSQEGGRRWGCAGDTDRRSEIKRVTV